jgi:hypothetical protein
VACDAARRIASRRCWCSVALFAIATLASAEWGSNHYCRLAEDRFLLLTGTQRFVLTHAAAWELADSAQKDAFDKWLTQTKLPKDLGQLVANAPADHEMPLAGEIDTAPAVAGETDVLFKREGALPESVKLAAISDGAKPDADSANQFAEYAKSLGKAPSTLLVLLADKSGAISDVKAWGAFLARIKAKPEFFVYLDKKLGLLWVRQTEASTTAGSKPATAVDNEPSSEGSKDQEAAPKKRGSDTSGTLLLIGGGVLVLAVGGVAGYLIGTRRQASSGSQSVTAAAPAGPAKFIVNAQERELIEKVRDEIGKLGWSANHIPSADEYMVGQVIDRYNGYPALAEEVARLSTYRQFKESHDLFQKRIDASAAEAKASSAKVGEITAVLERERAKLRELAEQLKQAQEAHAASAGEATVQKKRVKDLERKNLEFQQTYVELMNRTSAVCHDIVLTRPRGDAWALAFAYLVDYTLAYLGLARQCDDSRTLNAMVANLSRLSEAMAKSFPDRKLVIDPWQRSVKAFGDVKPPSYDAKPHPQVDSLSQILLTLRDTGPRLPEFREFFAPSETGLHIIRPA